MRVGKVDFGCSEEEPCYCSQRGANGVQFVLTMSDWAARVDDPHWQHGPVRNNKLRNNSAQSNLEGYIEPNVTNLSKQSLPQIKTQFIKDILFYLRKPPPSREALLPSNLPLATIPNLPIPSATPQIRTHHHLFLLSSALRHSISRSLSHMRSDLTDLPFTASCSCVCGVLYQ